MAAQSLALAATLLSFAPHGNRVELKLDHGAAEIAWLSPSSFRFRRAFSPGSLPKTTWGDGEHFDLKIAETPAGLEFTTRFLRVSIARRGLLVRARNNAGERLMEEAAEATLRDGVLRQERVAEEGVRYFGLGRRAAMSFDLRGQRVRAETPLLVSTAGYGEYHGGPGTYTFDLGAARKDRYAIEARDAALVDYCFYYGPNPKEIFEEHLAARGALEITPAERVPHASWDTLRDTMLRMVQGSMAGMTIPTFDARPYLTAPAELAGRAKQFAEIAPALVPANAAGELRRRLKTFFATYEIEVRDRGFPILHPLPFQFPSDPRAHLYADEFMVGDELLAAPVYTASGKRSVYLPQGIWTDWETNREYKGRQTIEVASQGLPLFGRNGNIVPVDPIKRGEPMALHYFPRLGAEFFLLEQEIGDYSQVHAGPAADVWRLEIESKVERDYEWVLHNMGRPAAVERPSGGKAPEWRVDEKGNLHVRAHVREGEDCIINLKFPE